MKAGRKAQSGPRYPGGKLMPQNKSDADTAPALIKRMVDDAKRGAADPRLGTAVGRLYLDGALNDKQFAAADAYARLRGRFDRAMGMRRRGPASPSYGLGGGGGAVPDFDDDELRALKREHVLLLQTVGAAYAMLERAVIDDVTPAWAERRSLATALDRVAALIE